MNHISTRTIESKAFPGVRFVIRKMTKRRADQLTDLQAQYRERLRPLYGEFNPLDKEREDSKDFPAEKLHRWSELLAQISKIDRNEMAPAAMRFCLVRIEEAQITYADPDGVDRTEPATLDLVMEHGPDELYDEILTEVKRECGLLPEEQENLNSASTSAAAVDGNPESAVPAESAETITPVPA